MKNTGDGKSSTGHKILRTAKQLSGRMPATTVGPDSTLGARGQRIPRGQQWAKGVQVLGTHMGVQFCCLWVS